MKSQQYSEEARHAARWWRDLQPDPETGKPGNRGALAQLRRCSTVAEAMLEPATQTLIRACGVTHSYKVERLALVAAVLAHVRKTIPTGNTARRLGPTDGNDASSALCKPLRFRRLLDADDPNECLRVFRRLVSLLDATAHIADLADAVIAWPRTEAYDDDRADRIRIRWVYAYWNAGTPEDAPAPVDSEKEAQS